MTQEYPKEVRIRDGNTVTLRLFEKGDTDALFAFFAKLPEGDRLYLKDNVTDRAIIDRWASELNYEKVFPVLAWKGSEVLANATLHKNSSGWMKHVGTIRMVTAPDYHRKGLGAILANELFLRFRPGIDSRPSVANDHRQSPGDYSNRIAIFVVSLAEPFMLRESS